MKISIMQPYFIPYAGYMRLLACSDLFVIYDCVQFPRRSWVHRNKLKSFNGELDWLTLPIEKAEFDEKILNIKFRHDARAVFNEACSKFPSIENIKNTHAELYNLLINFNQTLAEYNVSILKYFSNLFNFKPAFIYSSSLNLPDTYKGQDRIIKIAQLLGGVHYINSPGGISLYESSAFERQGIKLDFLTEYQGDFSSILQLLTEYDLAELQLTILDQCRYITTRNVLDGQNSKSQYFAAEE